MADIKKLKAEKTEAEKLTKDLNSKADKIKKEMDELVKRDKARKEELAKLKKENDDKRDRVSCCHATTFAHAFFGTNQVLGL